MPVDPYRNVVKAVDSLTTQVRRVAEAMVTPVVEDADARQTTGDDAPRQPAYDSVLAYIRSQPTDFLPATVVERNAIIWHAVHAALDAMPEHPAVAELARIRRALDPDDETYIRETVDDFLALNAKVTEQQATIERLAAALREVLGTYARASTPPNGKVVGYQGPAVEPAMFERWSAALGTITER